MFVFIRGDERGVGEMLFVIIKRYGIIYKESHNPASGENSVK